MINQAPEFPRKYLMDDGLCRDNQVATRFRDSQVSESPATSARQVEEAHEWSSEEQTLHSCISGGLIGAGAGAVTVVAPAAGSSAHHAIIRRWRKPVVEATCRPFRRQHRRELWAPLVQLAIVLAL